MGVNRVVCYQDTADDHPLFHLFPTLPEPA